ncbi:MAG: DUF1659 domain-containing protein [Atribacterota bacterium]
MPPVVVVEQPNRLRIRVQIGENPDNGRPLTRTVSFRVKENASYQDIYDVALALSGLLAYPVFDISLTENKVLTE